MDNKKHKNADAIKTTPSSIISVVLGTACGLGVGYFAWGGVVLAVGPITPLSLVPFLMAGGICGAMVGRYFESKADAEDA